MSKAYSSNACILSSKPLSVFKAFFSNSFASIVIILLCIFNALFTVIKTFLAVIAAPFTLPIIKDATMYATATSCALTPNFTNIRAATSIAKPINKDVATAFNAPTQEKPTGLPVNARATATKTITNLNAPR